MPDLVSDRPNPLWPNDLWDQPDIPLPPELKFLKEIFDRLTQREAPQPNIDESVDDDFVINDVLDQVREGTEDIPLQEIRKPMDELMRFNEPLPLERAIGRKANFPQKRLPRTNVSEDSLDTIIGNMIGFPIPPIAARGIGKRIISGAQNKSSPPNMQQSIRKR